MAAHRGLRSPLLSNRMPGESTPRSARKGKLFDRFIPDRSAMNFDVASMLVLGKENFQKSENIHQEEYRKQLAENLLQDSTFLNEQNRILAFRSKPQQPPLETKHLFPENTMPSSRSRKVYRHIPQSADKTLDAPEILDDYYINLLDWGSRNVVSIALGNTVYLWHAGTGSIEELLQLPEGDGPVTSVCWAPDGQYLSVGLNNAAVELWDTTALRRVRTLTGHTARVGSLAWNGPILTTGGGDNMILNHDVRIRDHLTAKMTGHLGEICGLKWSPSGQQLASGANDNTVYIWDAAASVSRGTSTHLYRLDEHRAAVKALAWCPFQSNLLATGGGSADRSIKFWNTHLGSCIQTVETDSQVCGLQWSKHEKELLSSHGYSQNQLTLWKYPSMVKLAELTGHTSRVLHLATSPDGYTVASAAGDETLRFWNVFGNPEASKAAAAVKKAKEAGSAFHHIRGIR